MLVHCHAGYGRTGVIIACYLIFTTNLNPEDIIKSIRSYRANLVQKKEQFLFCIKFKQCKYYFLINISI